MCLQEGRGGKGLCAFSASALWELSVEKYQTTRISQYFCKVLNKVSADMLPAAFTWLCIRQRLIT